MATSRWAIVLALVVLAAPQVLAHGGHQGDDHDEPAPPPVVVPTERDPWWSTWSGHSWYGPLVALASSPTPIRHLRASGDFVVWESAGDIMALHAASGTTFNVTRDGLGQSNPVVDGRHVVYEQRNGTTWDLYGYDLDTGLTRQLTSSPGNEREPYVRGDWLVWLDDRHGHAEVYAKNLANGTEFPVALSKAKKFDPLLLDDGVVAWREIEYNQWDVAVRRLPAGEVKFLTRDRTLEHPPQTDGRSLYWLKASSQSRENALYRWDPETGDIVSLGKKGITTNPMAFLPHGVELVYASGAGGLVTYTAVNRSSDRYTAVSGPFPGSTPVAGGDSIFIAARNETEHVVLAARISPYAVQPPPKLTIARPLEGGVLFGPAFAAGSYQHAPSWPEPLRFEHRLAQIGAASEWKPFSASDNWTILLDTSTVEPGVGIRFQVRAVYENAPAAQESVALTLRIPSATPPLSLAGQADVSLANFVEKNPGVVLLVGLFAAFLVLLLARWRLRRGRRFALRIEYVRPDEDGGSYR